MKKMLLDETQVAEHGRMKVFLRGGATGEKGHRFALPADSLPWRCLQNWLQSKVQLQQGLPDGRCRLMTPAR